MTLLSLETIAWPTRAARPVSGTVHPDFELVADALRAQLRAYPGGAGVCVYHRGECVVDLWGGDADADGAPWRSDTMSPSFSTTKGVAATTLHVMVDRGLVDYDDRVSRVWPEFGQAGKADITIRQVLAHQSGLYHIRQMIDRADRMLDWEHMIGAIERTPPIHPPGTRTGYHGLTFGFIVGEIIQRVTGRPFPEVVREVIAEPLGCDGLYIGAPADQVDRAAQLIWPTRGWLVPKSRAFALLPHGQLGLLSATTVQRLLDLARVPVDIESILDALAPRGIGSFDFGSTETLRASIPAANGLFTARSLARMYAALASGGQLGGTRLLSAEGLRRATELQPPPTGRAVIPFDMRWRLGYHGVFTSRGIPKHAFGHFGFGGSGAFADPRRELAVGLIVNSGMGTPFGDLRIVRIGGAAVACANARSTQRAAA